ncbi:MAG: heme ABC exporter ATP-binding protein CcmA [Chloroflexi bacterium]|nr:heme ABC exporter ATP-binding protein CcmA [Chloroflexota bacterium]
MSQPSRDSLAIKVKGLSKAFGRTGVLRNLDLEVPWGEFLAIFGANGSGKTTLIRTLASLTRPDSGQIDVAGLSSRREGEKIRTIIGVVTHNILLYEELTVYENLKFYGRMFALKDVDQRINDAVGQMGLSHRMHQRVRILSHGMQKRLSIARALLHHPSILLLDEPESGLDQEALGLLQKAIGITKGSLRAVLMTTHNVEYGLSMADRVAIIADGKIVHKESKETLDVAGFRNTYLHFTGSAL